MDLVLVLGNQLFSVAEYRASFHFSEKVFVFIREDRELCTYYKFHKHKIIFFLAAMREYRKEWETEKISLHYEFLGQDSLRYEDSLWKFIKKNKIKTVYFFEIEDKFFEKRLKDLFTLNGIFFHSKPSPMFLSSREDFREYLKSQKKPFMKTFYERMRKNNRILVTDKGEPLGGRWSFDSENRKALPKSLVPSEPLAFSLSQETKEVIQLVEKEFPDHPGKGQNFYLPVTRNGAKKWFWDFLDNRMEQFGPYEDALSEDSDFVYHSFLTPFLNVGLLSPKEVLLETINMSQKRNIPLESLEGFIRQILGWREFVRGIYQNFSELQEKQNHFGHTRKLSSHWYEGNTGIPPLDHVIRKVLRLGYSHHIERLMVVGSLMLLLEIDPREAHRWFMEMYIDSSDWVMGPNVYGMALFSDGGIFATKPYFCGSNYYKKMGHYDTKGAWALGVDGLYWRFIHKHRQFFLKNPRLSMMVKSLEKMDAKRKAMIFSEAELLIKKLTL